MLSSSWIERYATSGTGRVSLESRPSARRHLVLYPNHVSFRDLIRTPKDEMTTGVYYLGYGRAGSGAIRLRDVATFIVCLLKVTTVIDEIHLYCLSRRRDHLFGAIAGTIGRLAGAPMTLHDYRFGPGHGRKGTSKLDIFSTRIEFGDTTAFDVKERLTSYPSCRIESMDMSSYFTLTKKQAVPRVIVSGDFEDGKIQSLASRIFELVKHKYPRTEFFLTSLTVAAGFGPGDHSIRVCAPRRETDLRDIFIEADTLLLLSPGGVNRFFISRAYAAGYPVIVNGLDYSAGGSDSGRIMNIPRDSYSGMADAIIALVDDDVYYRSFAERRNSL